MAVIRRLILCGRPAEPFSHSLLANGVSFSESALLNETKAGYIPQCQISCEPVFWVLFDHREGAHDDKPQCSVTNNLIKIRSSLLLPISGPHFFDSGGRILCCPVFASFWWMFRQKRTSQTSLTIPANEARSSDFIHGPRAAD